MSKTEAILVLPQLRIQNANAIASPLTHGFPSITAFTGLMWALERKLNAAGVPLHLHSVGVICHHQQEQVTQGYVRSFNLMRNPVGKDGSTAAIVEEGRTHLCITLVFAVAEKDRTGAAAVLMDGNEAQWGNWASKAGDILAGMRVAGGSVLPSLPMPGKRVRPWLAIVPEDPEAAQQAFARWRRQWLPGFALVGRDDLLAQRLQDLQVTEPGASLLDAWLHTARFNYQPLANEDGSFPPDGKVDWGDLQHQKGAGWIVPIPVGYAGLTPAPHPAGSVRHARDPGVPLHFVESVHSLGEWISPHRLKHLDQLLWQPETDAAQGLYRCRNAYKLAATNAESADEFDDPEAYDYT